VKYLDNIPDDVITELNIPTGAPLIYHLDENLKPIPHKDAIAPLQVRSCASISTSCHIFFLSLNSSSLCSFSLSVVFKNNSPPVSVNGFFLYLIKYNLLSYFFTFLFISQIALNNMKLNDITYSQGHYIGNQDEIRARILGVKNQTK
jgi:hypothetical protein